MENGLTIETIALLKEFEKRTDEITSNTIKRKDKYDRVRKIKKNSGTNGEGKNEGNKERK